MLCRALNRYPVNIIPKVTIPKNIAISFSFIALLRIIASGKLSADMAIIKARAVPIGIPFWNKANAIGTIAAQLPYIGTPIKVATGTVNIPPWPISL